MDKWSYLKQKGNNLLNNQAYSVKAYINTNNDERLRIKDSKIFLPKETRFSRRIKALKELSHLLAEDIPLKDCHVEHTYFQGDLVLKE